MPSPSQRSSGKRSAAERRTPQAVLETLDANPGLTLSGYISAEAASTKLSEQQLRRTLWAYRGDPVHGQRFRELFEADTKEQAGVLEVLPDRPPPDPGNPKEVWIDCFLRTRKRIDACALAGVTMGQVAKWLDPANKEHFDPHFASEYADGVARIVAILEDDVETARQIAIATGDAKTLALIALKTLSALKPEVYGNRAHLRIEGSVDHRARLPAEANAQIEERVGRLLGRGEDDVIDAESEVVS